MLKSSLFKKVIYVVTAILVVTSIAWYYLREVYVGEIQAGTLSIGNTTIVVETANTYTARITGLGGREGIGEREGMIFEFMDEGLHEFWMKDMKFSIDIIWLDKDFKIVDIKENLAPETYPQTFGPKENSKYTLEVKAGFVERHDVKIGDTVSFVDHSVK